MSAAADLIPHNATLTTRERANPQDAAVAVTDARLTAVGEGAHHGACLPGRMDSRTHGVRCGLDYNLGPPHIHMRRLLILLVFTGLLGPAAATAFGAPATPAVAVGAQYDTTHVYVPAEDFDRFTDSIVATFGGHKSKQGVFQVTPTPSQTLSQLVLTPVGTLSVFGFKTPIPYPFGAERTGYLVTDLDVAVKSAAAHGADVPVAIFPDPIGRDAIIEWPGGVYMQLYWHTEPPHYDALKTIPENRVYVSRERADAFVRGFTAFAHGRVVSDNRTAPGAEIGRPADTYRRVRIDSTFGKVTVLVTDGHLPYPFGRELMGYEVQDLTETLRKAQGAGATVLIPPFTADHRLQALVQFPGGYIAEVHAPAP